MPDYSNPPSLNRYAYVYNNPLKYIGPSGHCGIVGGGAGHPAVMSHSCLEALGGAAVAYAVAVAANQFDLDLEFDLTLNRPSSSPPIQVSSTDIFVLEYPETEGQRPVLIAPEHTMHTPPMDLNPDLENSNASSGRVVSELSQPYLTITLPSNPNDLLNQGWVNVTAPRMAANSNRRAFLNLDTGQRIAFDEGQPDARGWEGRDHYHIYHPSSTGKSDLYLDVVLPEEIQNNLIFLREVNYPKIHYHKIMKPSLFFETFTLHDSGLEKFDYYPNKQVCILEVELCNWMQACYQEEEAEIILGDLIFNGVRQLEIEEDETLLSHTHSISKINQI